ncbi:MAG: DUF4390 domain-containing protein [Proteobacteria bacterium]|nr:DUF4390 domain-containing protein [Pseudomonadota bacterium]
MPPVPCSLLLLTRRLLAAFGCAPALGLALALALVWARPAAADALDGVLEVRSAYVNIDKGVFLLYSRVEYPMTPAINEALRDGISLTFDLEVRVERQRRMWFNSSVVDLTLRRELTYHVVSDRYVVHDVRSGDQTTFATLDEALAFLGKVDAWPVLVEPQLDGGNYTISVRAGMRRGHLPASLRAILFWTDDWARQSEWYTWSLPV